MKYPGKEAYHFPVGPSHTSPCMDPYFRSPEYQAKKERWLLETGITAGITILIDHDRDEKTGDEDNETEKITRMQLCEIPSENGIFQYNN
ncbi:hypothetical protein MSBR3_0560 [Methanosarcina barkeri 3]|uniref:Uncharacterized protein n=1 Tax=Methanosarcina barkeri 3 TaxID=1434107 RepID=A0A0E3SKM0_METBA|nr:hypothetical protein [Methanosarcina barkeri]AKB81138.1 hypothetical protein MSBR3_0560 [Methanosarcina barkeri 3]